MRSLIVFLMAAAIARAGAPVNPDAAILADFTKRVNEYQQVHKDCEAGLMRLKTTRAPREISDHEHELAHSLREVRKNAREGDVFTPPIAAEFRRLIGIAMQGNGSPRVHESLKSAEPVHLVLHVNDSYPTGIPLQSTPPTLLTNLPPLPPELEYHLVGHELILLDVKANLIVDKVANAI